MIESKIIAIHQPNFLPALSYFYKIWKSDLFVIYDTAKYSKNSYTNRNRILLNGKSSWITIPILHEEHYQEIRYSKIGYQNLRHDKLLKKIEAGYRNATYFHQYFAEFKSVFLENLNQPYISELNITLISWVCDKLEIPWQNVKASLLASKKGTATEKLISICKEVHGTEYLSGGGGRKYLKEDLFTDYQLTLTYSGYVNANHLTILDALFHIGPDKILDDFKKNIVNVGKIKDGT